MERYLNLDGDSGVTEYETGSDYIVVQFRGGKLYRYSHARAGQIHVTRMKALAESGRGLSTYISQHMRELHDSHPAPIRVATMADVPALQELIVSSVRKLSPGYYSPVQIESVLTGVIGVDTQLIADGTYYVIDGPAGPIACGGWSGRRTLFGGDQMKDAEDPRLDPRTEPAKIRAFFVHPDFARRGLGRQLYRECERAARSAGFTRLELMATLPGEPLYTALGFSVVERHTLTLPDGVELPFAHMAKELVAADG